jgi:hypothetical protein
MDNESKSPLELVWEYREERIYPLLFGDKFRGTFVLSGQLFRDVFQQQEIDPRWLNFGVIEFEPTESRPSWLYVTSGASNPWELDPSEYANSEFSGFGTEIVLETEQRFPWAIPVLQRLLAFNILLAHGRLGNSNPLDYGDRVPLRGPITFDDSSLLTHILLGAPDHYDASFRLASGKVDFLHAVGITESERNFAKESGSDALIELLKASNAFPVTRPERKALI